MALSTSRVCVPQNERQLCPRKKSLCPAGCKPGFCLNATCVCNSRPEMFYCHPEADREADLYRQRVESAAKQQKLLETAAFLAGERKAMGMSEPGHEGPKFPSWYQTQPTSTRQGSAAVNPLVDLSHLQGPEGRKTMRAPARPACMLAVPELCPEYDDLSQLSLFLRTSTLPRYAPGDGVSEYRDTHNMAVWNNKRDMDRQRNRFRRDWLAIWVELNVKDQRWRKAWAEKFSGAGVGK